jgi:CAAX protease family protein
MRFLASGRDERDSAAIAVQPDRDRVSVARRLWLTLEMMLFFVLTPIGVYSLLYGYHVPLFRILPPVFLFVIVVLTIDRSFSWRRALSRLPRLRDLASILAIFAVAGPAIVLFAKIDVPDRFLAFPRYAYGIWILVMILYPLISVTTQEIMYRVFFFHRYRALFAGDPQGGIVLNAVLFSFSHIVFQNITTLIISFLGGLLFAWRYQTSRSYWALVFEHALYGNLIFTVGLGRYFYTGISNF